MYLPQITPQALDQLLHDFITVDPRVRTFRLGDVWEAEGSVEDGYPLVMYELVSSKLTQSNFQWSTAYTLRLYAFDKRLEDGSNVVQVFSETQNILTDLIVRMQGDADLEEKGFRWSKDTTIDYVLKSDRQDLVGCSVELQVITPVQLCPDQLPS